MLKKIEIKMTFLTLYTGGVISLLNSFVWFNFGWVDSLALSLLVLLGLIFFMITLLESTVKTNLLFIIMVMAFSSLYLLEFYLFFELSLIPMFMIIYSKGKQYERISAGLYLILYTLIFSLPLLINILYMGSNHLLFLQTNWSAPTFFVSLAPLSFLVKMPIYVFHSWLPKAHVEAPAFGSMILASVMLKLGGFGFIKFLSLIPLSMLSLKVPLFEIMILGALLTSIMCMFIPDVKVMIALSSVSHMSLMGAALITLMPYSKLGSLMMISHGASSSISFYLLNAVYKRTNSRSIYLFKKCMWSMSMVSFFFLMSLINFSIPPFLGFFSEVSIFMSIVSFTKLGMSPIVLYVICSTIYSLYLFYNCSNPGKAGFGSSDMKMSEIWISGFHIWFSLFLMIYLM